MGVLFAILFLTIAIILEPIIDDRDYKKFNEERKKNKFYD